MDSSKYWVAMRNSVTYQQPLRRIIDVSNRGYEAQRKAEIQR